jgi:hypothetical protein
MLVTAAIQMLNQLVPETAQQGQEIIVPPR